MDLGQKDSHVEKFIRDNSIKVNRTVMDNIFGLMEAITKEISKTVSKMVREYGSYLQEIVINMKVSMLKAKNRAMESLLGILETSTKEIILRMKEKALGRCLGLMEAIIKETGTKVSKKEKVYLQ